MKWLCHTQCIKRASDGLFSVTAVFADSRLVFIKPRLHQAIDQDKTDQKRPRDGTKTLRNWSGDQVQSGRLPHYPTLRQKKTFYSLKKTQSSLKSVFFTRL